MSNILELGTIIGITDPTPLRCSEPYFNGVFVVQGDTLNAEYMGVYYGDEVNLNFWKQLDLDMGIDTTDTTLYKLTTGYKYVYYVSTRKFIITDDSGNVVYTANNVKSIKEFKIDMEIYKSHQLEIVISPNSDIYSYYLVVRLLKKDDGAVSDKYDYGVNNIDITDRVRPYGKDDPDNPTWNILYLGQIAEGIDLFLRDNTNCMTKDEYLIGSKVGDINYSKISTSNNFYADGIKTMVASLYENQYVCTVMAYSLVLPNLSTDMFPQLLPVDKLDELCNNKPVYEPWLIWGIYKFLTSHITVDKDDPSFEVVPFDLSPIYS